MIKFLKKLFHSCKYFRWEIGYGITKWGHGQYQYQVCIDCKKEKLTEDGMVELHNFVKDRDLYK